MLSSFFVVCTAVVAVYLLSLARSLRQNLLAARQCGLPYIIVPAYARNIGILIFLPLLLPILRQLPGRWTEQWLPWLDPNHLWHQGHRSFHRLGADVFIAVAPQRNILWTCDAEVNHQILTRRSDFPKPLEIYRAINGFGPSIVGSEGAEWRRYRKVTAHALGEGTNRAVWSRTLLEVAALRRAWAMAQDGGGGGHGHGHRVGLGFKRLTLHVINFVCYGKGLRWPESAGREIPPQGHRLTYAEALITVLDQLVVLFLSPSLVLDYSPFEVHKLARTPFREWQRYVREMHVETVEKLRFEPAEKELNLLESLVLAAPPPSNTPDQTPVATKARPEDATISLAALFGNIFVFLTAGYETTANTLLFAVTLLACFPDVQATLQADLDRIFHGQRPDEQHYEQHLPALLNGYAGAIMNETLRLFPLLPSLYKCTQSAQALTVAGRAVVVPANTLVKVAVSATQRNPRYWPAPRPRWAGEHRPHVLSSFDPARWFQPTANDPDDADHTPSGLVSPPPGAFVPFSEGARACPGQRFAQVEICAAIAAIFCDCSVELVVVSEDGAGGQSRRARWQHARDAAERRLTEGMGFVMTLKMGEEVPLALVKRGEEKWRDL